MMTFSSFWVDVAGAVHIILNRMTSKNQPIDKFDIYIP